MSNPLKYVTSTPTGALRHANLGAGVASIQYDETFTSGLNPSALTTYYLVYEPVEGASTRIYAPANSTELITLAQSKGSTETTEAGALTWLSDNGYYPANKVLDNVVTDNLVLYFDASSATSYPRSGTNLLDLSGETNDGTLINGPTFNPNGYLDFDGVDDRVNVGNPDTLNFVTDVSCEVVFKRNSNAVQNLRLLSKGGGGASTSQNGFSYFGSNTSISFACTNNAVRNIQGTTITTDKWYHVVGIINQTSNKIQVYLNGVLTNSVTLSGTGTMVGGSDLNIGMFGNSSLPWDGDIENVKIYSTPLTEAEVFQNYYQGSIVTDDLDFAVDAGNLVSFEPETTAAFSLTGSSGAAAGDGVLTNGVGYSDSGNGTWTFDGTDDFINFGTPTALAYIYTDPFSLEVWCKPDATSGFKHLIGKSYSDYRLAQNGSGISFRLDSNNLTTQVGLLVAGEWTHIVATWEPSTSTAYVYQDGALKGSVTDATVDWSSSPNRFQIGTSPGESYYFDGSIAIGRAYGKTLSLVEVQKNYNANIKKFT